MYVNQPTFKIPIYEMLSHYLSSIDHDAYYGMFLYLGLFVGISVLWDVYFMKRIHYFVKIYLKSLKKVNTNSLVNYSETALHYKVEIFKYLFLMGINIAETSAVVLFGLGLGVSLINPSYDILNNCTTGDVFNLDLQLIVASPVAGVFISFGQVGLMFSFVLGICLMRYLDVTIHNINANPFHYVNRMLLVSCIIGVLLVIIGSIPHLFPISKLFVPIIQFVYFCIWLKQTRTFYKTLKWRYVEFKVRGMRSQIVSRSVVACNQFACIMGIME